MLAPLLEQEIASASHCARRIQQREPIPQGIDLERSPCGYQYSAAVIDSLKGEQDHITFFAVNEGLEIGHEYLVFIHKVSPDDIRAATRLRDLLPASESQMLACRVADMPYYLPVERQTYFAFDTVAAHRLGGEWLRLHDEGQAVGFTWCFADWPSNVHVPRRNILITKEMEAGKLASEVLGWESAKTLIREAQSNSPRWWGVFPNPFFKPGSC